MYVASLLDVLQLRQPVVSRHWSRLEDRSLTCPPGIAYVGPHQGFFNRHSPIMPQSLDQNSPYQSNQPPLFPSCCLPRTTMPSKPGGILQRLGVQRPETNMHGIRSNQRSIAQKMAVPPSVRCAIESWIVQSCRHVRPFMWETSSTI